LSNKLKTICWVTPFQDASRPTNAQHIPPLLPLPTCTNPLPLLGLLPLLIPKSTYAHTSRHHHPSFIHRPPPLLLQAPLPLLPQLPRRPTTTTKEWKWGPNNG
jgi:hypothetical protein